MDDLHTASTVVDEAKAFMDRHKELNETQAVMGGMWFGFLRALMECSECPGYYRVPLDKEWYRPGGRLYCVHCGGVWIRQPDIEPQAKKKNHH
jgi:hypothetical protein